jgi:uncharacterized protein YggE
VTKQLKTILLAAMLAAPLAAPSALAQTDVERAERRLTVVGEGRVEAPPDTALISLGVVSEAETAGAALSANSQSMARILETLKGAGIAPRDLQTSGLSVEPRYSQPPRDYDGSQPFEPRIVGYSVRNSVALRIRDLAQVGTLLDTVVSLGANTVSGPIFTVEEPTALEDAARREAIADARRKAELYAEAAGVPLGPLLRVEEGYGSGPQPVPMLAMARDMAAAPPVPIEAGELSFAAQVSVTWGLPD